MARSSVADRGVAYFPAFLDLVRKKVVVVGGGTIATGKVRALLPCQPWPLVVVAPRASTLIQASAEAGRLIWHARAYAPHDLLEATLVFAATNDRALNAQVAAAARQLAIPVLAVDDVPSCDFIAPALVRRGELTVAISTSGRSPAMARRTRELLDRALPASWGDLLEVAASVRDQLGEARARIDPEHWQAALSGEVERLAAGGALDQAANLLRTRLERGLSGPSPAAHPEAEAAAEAEAETDAGLPGALLDRLAEPRHAADGGAAQVAAGSGGLVSLVGAGPGDPELLTLRALRRLEAADVVVHDRLVTSALLAYARPDAERIDVGKAAGGRGWSQSAIDALLVSLGQAGKRVVRLKGGDPFLFGRGGEEALALTRAGVAWEVVPGVSSALAAPAAAGIPVTHRGLSASVTIANGHDCDQHDWSALAQSAGTLVFLMAVERLEDIAAHLLAGGRPTDEPAAIVQWATTPRQRVVTAGLAQIGAAARAAHIEAPAILIVGPTAALADTLRAAPRPAEAASDPAPSAALGA